MKNALFRNLGLVVLYMLYSTALVSAQTGSIWNTPIRMSDPSYVAQASSIAADSAGNVHLMWSSTLTDNNTSGLGDTLFYVRWDGESWTTPVDVLVSPGGNGAGWPELATTPDGMLHAIWTTGGRTNNILLYSHAPACCADKPQSWSQPLALDSGVFDTTALVADKLGRLHIAFSALSASSKISYIRSDDGGQSWPIYEEIDGGSSADDEYTINPRLAVDDRNRVHAVWTVQPWPGRSVIYARSDNGGETWNSPKVIDSADHDGYQEGYGPLLIDVETFGEDQVHLIWDGAPTIERTHVWSSDGGKTWSPRQLLFPEVTYVGRAGWNDMVFDSTGILHAVSMSPGSVWYSSWNGDTWSPSKDISQGIHGPHFLHITISLGNQLHVTWLNKAVAPATIWHVWGETPAQAVARITLPTLQPATTLPPTTIPPAEDIRFAPKLLDSDLLDGRESGSQNNGVIVMFFGAIPALVIVVVTLTVQLRRRRH